MSIETQIENQIRTLMLADESFDTLQVIYRGVTVGDVPTMYYPYAEVSIMTWKSLRVLTGNRREREYGGQIRFWMLHQDLPEVIDRAADIDSYLVIQQFLKAVDVLLGSSTNKTLGGLTFSDPVGRVTKFELISGVYGIDDRTERQTSLDNFGLVDFIVTTLEDFN